MAAIIFVENKFNDFVVVSHLPVRQKILLRLFLNTKFSKKKII